MLRQEFLSECQGQRRGDPADLHDGHKARSNSSPDLVECPGAGDDGHGGKVDRILNWRDLRIEKLTSGQKLVCCIRWIGETHNQIADENLQYLCLKTCPPREQLLQYMNQEVSQRRANERAIDSHLRHTRADVVSIFGDILGNPGRKDFL